MRISAVLATIVALGLAGCSSAPAELVGLAAPAKLDPFAGTGSPHWKGPGPIPKGGGRYHVGKPYQVAGVSFVPKADPNYDRTGQASWYGEAFHARMTSNGEYFNMNDMTAAHATLPIPSYAKVTNLANGREIIVRINDRGPFVGTRIIDLSKKSASTLDFQHKGKANVRVQWIGPAPLDDQGQHLAGMNKKLRNGASISQMRRSLGESAMAQIDNDISPANDTP
jgi:rare lipoprotein A